VRRANVERLVATAFVISILAGLGLGAVYWNGGQPQLEGMLLALSLGGIGIGMVAWAKKFLPNEEVEEERKPIESTEEDVAAFTRDYEQGEEQIGRRRLLTRLLLGAIGSLGLAALFPIRSLGPRPGRGLFETAFGSGVRVVNGDGDPVKPADVGPGVVVTVWPDGAVGDADSPTLLIGVGDPELFTEETRQGTVDGIVAYSKLCTHTGCPVGLYQQEERLLLCPCHQSTFEVLNGAAPIFGPATRALPQLPLDLDGEGYIIATGDFESPAGPGFWNRQQHD
jgi:ubiquinol-cytochrome c reductase iron-sulfur subunit